MNHLWADELYSKTCFKGPLKKKTKIGFHDRLSLNAGQKYCRMLQGEHSAILRPSLNYRKRSGSVVECLTQDQGATGSSVTVLFP